MQFSWNFQQNVVFFSPKWDEDRGSELGQRGSERRPKGWPSPVFMASWGTILMFKGRHAFKWLHCKRHWSILPCLSFTSTCILLLWGSEPWSLEQQCFHPHFGPPEKSLKRSASSPLTYPFTSFVFTVWWAAYHQEQTRSAKLTFT